MALLSIDGATKLTGLIGSPVTHSRSPAIHQHWLQEHTINARYLAFEVASNNLKEAVKGAAALGFLGLNVTVPYKERVLDFVNSIEEDARYMGAANTLIFSGENIHAANTDVYGIVANLTQDGRCLAQLMKRVMILGAGGAARAAVAACAQMGAVEIRLCNRTLENARALAKTVQMPVEIVPWHLRESALEGASLLINTTSLGMKNTAALDLDLAVLPPDALVHDIVYAPLHTDLLQRAKTRGNPVLTGIGMLAYQAQKAFELWHGVRPAVTDALLVMAAGNNT